MNITLTDEQNNALIRILSFLSGKRRVHLLKGTAGSGKSTLVNLLVQILKNKDHPLNHYLILYPEAADKEMIHITAMTHKALYILVNMYYVDCAFDDIFFTTFHSFTRCKVDKLTNKVIYPKRIPYDVKSKLVIIDEASMMDTGMVKFFRKVIAQSPNTKFLLLGDEYQLTYKLDNHPPIFVSGIETTELTQSVRQSSPTLAALCEYLRECVKENRMIDLDRVMNTPEVTYIEPGDEFQLREEWMDKNINAFVLSYTNNKVDYYTKILKPIPSGTIHKAQGSTYDEVLIDLSSFSRANQLHKFLKLFYVGVSRARNKVYLTGKLPKYLLKLMEPS